MDVAETAKVLYLYGEIGTWKFEEIFYFRVMLQILHVKSSKNI